MLLTGIPALVCSLAGAAVVPMDSLSMVVFLLLPQAMLLMAGCIGLSLNLKNPDLHWTSEAIPIKQGTPVLLTMLCSMGYLLLAAGLYTVLHRFLSDGVYLLLMLVLTECVCTLLIRWLKTKGARIFAAL